MTRAEIDDICAELPGAQPAAPPKPDSWQVGGKMFAFFGTKESKGSVSLHASDPETAKAMISSGKATEAPYFKAPWVQLDLDDLAPDLARDLVATSYDIIRGGLTKKAQAALPQRETP